MDFKLELVRKLTNLILQEPIPYQENQNNEIIFLLEH